MAITPGAVLGAASIGAATSGGTSNSASTARNNAQSTSSSRTYGNAATSQAMTSAERANNIAIENWTRAADFNAEEAEKARAWQERMANTVYQRTVKDMIAAGINPILAANMGLGTASVSSAPTATMGNPMSYMANTYPESQSSSQSTSEGYSESYSQSLSGLAYLADAIGNAIGAMTSAHNISISLEGLRDIFKDDTTGDGKKDVDDIVQTVAQVAEEATGIPFTDKFVTKGSKKYDAIKKTVPQAYSTRPWEIGRINEASWGSK